VFHVLLLLISVEPMRMNATYMACSSVNIQAPEGLATQPQEDVAANQGLLSLAI
jgi:hypothetical protein